MDLEGFETPNTSSSSSSDVNSNTSKQSNEMHMESDEAANGVVAGICKIFTFNFNEIWEKSERK
jgi:hypothetical protein